MGTVTMERIEQLARTYAVQRGGLVELVNGLHNEIERAKAKYLASIRAGVAATKDAESALQVAIERAPDLFVKPRTVTLHGVKLGFQKGKGGIEFDEAEKVVARIERVYAEDDTMLEQLLRVKKSPNKEALEALDVASLKRLGCTVREAGDQVVIKPADGEVDKLVAALLKDDMQEAA